MAGMYSPVTGLAVSSQYVMFGIIGSGPPPPPRET